VLSWCSLAQLVEMVALAWLSPMLAWISVCILFAHAVASRFAFFPLKSRPVWYCGWNRTL
jgi:hypothetical protein